MVSQLSSKFSVFVLLITYTTGLSDFYDAFPTYTSSLDPFCSALSMPQWDPVTNLVLPGIAPPQDEYYETCNRGRRSISLYYPPALLPPTTCSCWPTSPIPQILTIDSSMLVKPLEEISQKLPVYIQMLEMPGCLPICVTEKEEEKSHDKVTTPAPHTEKPHTETPHTEKPHSEKPHTEKPDPGLSELAKPVIGAIKDAAKKAGMLEEAVAAKLIDLSHFLSTTVPPIETTTMPIIETTTEEVPVGTPPPTAEENAEIIDSRLAPNLPPMSSACIDPGTSRCFIETVSRPRVDFIAYELDLDH